MSLELLAMRWLRFEKKCDLVMLERCPRYMCGEPDVIGITKARYMTEIEIKRSMSDFRADFKKPHRKAWESDSSSLPKHIFYLAPDSLAQRLLPILPPWAGLLSGPTGRSERLFLLKEAPTNKLTRRLTVKECCRLVHLMSNHAISVFGAAQSWFNSFESGYIPWPEPDYEI